MRAAVLLLAIVYPLSAQEPTPEDLRLVERLAALPGDAEWRQLIESENSEITATLLRAILTQGNRDFAKDNERAARWYELVSDFAGRYQFADAQAAALGNIGAVYQVRSEYERALEYGQRALELAQKIGNRERVARDLLNISVVKRNLGDYSEAVAAARESVALTETLGAKALEGQARNALASALLRHGDFRQALGQYLKFLMTAQETGSPEDEAGALANLAGVYGNQGIWDLAVEYYQRSVRLQERPESQGLPASGSTSIGTRLYVPTLKNLAESLSQLGDNRGASEYAERALRLAESADNKRLIGQALATAANIDHAMGRVTKAIERHERAVALMESTGDREILLPALARQGQYQVETGQTEAGLDTLNRAMTMSRELGDRQSLLLACTVAGQAYRKLGRLGAARQSLLEAIATAESLTADISGGADAQQSFRADNPDPYREMVLVAVRESHADEAFRFAELGRTQALLEVLRHGRVSVNKAMTDEEKQQESRLRVHLAGLNERLSQARSAPTGERSKIRQIAEQLQQARVTQAAFETDLYAKHPELKSQRLSVPPPTPADVEASLPDRKTALLEYVVTGNQVFLFAIGRGVARTQLVRIPITAQALDAKVGAFARLIAERSLDYRTAAREIDKLLIEPARTALAGRTAVVIIPDGSLWRLPFQALESAQGESLLQRYTLSFAPSATVLRELMAKPPAGPVRTVLALGNPPGANLPEAESEVNALRELYGPGNTQVLTGAGATEAAFKAQAGRYDILHVASHGVIEDRNPLYSYVTLAKSETEDGFLEAREMLHLDLKAQLVVLSGCETARGKSSGGEGLIGMTWALFLAGTPATVTSGWKVDSLATARLMVEMHRGLRQGLGKAAALRTASLALRNDRRYQHPFYWAAFSLTGNGF